MTTVFNTEGTIQYTPSVGKTPHSAMWHWTNTLSSSRSTFQQKLTALDKMSTHFDHTTKAHFFAALTEVLRSERGAVIRETAIRMLGDYFDWETISMTFWLHAKRRREDIRVLESVERYAKAKPFMVARHPEPVER